jgi:SMODS-associating 2TM, beta-strand rich effector domain
VVTYNVDTDPRIRIYAVLAFASIGVASFLTDYLKDLASFLNDHLKVLGSVLPVVAAPSIAPFFIFGIFLWLFDQYLWKLPPINRVSGIPDLEGTWEGTLSRTSPADCEQPNTTEHNAICYITQTWRSMGVVFYDFPKSQEQVSGKPTRISTARTVGLFVKNPQDIHVRYVYGARQTTMLQGLDDVDAMPSEGAAVLRLRDLGKGNKLLWGTYYSDKVRRGDISLTLEDPGRPKEGAPPTPKSSSLF